MFIDAPLPFVKEYIEKINDSIRKQKPGYCLSISQKAWLAFCIMGILITNSISWAKFERASLGTYSLKALSWMFRHSKIPWDSMLKVSVTLILEEYGLTEGYLVLDDSNKKRSKTAKRIYKVHKLFDKVSGGYINGQEIVFLLLVTPRVTIPVGFSFYVPDPAYKAWKKQNDKLKKQGVPRKKRPVSPPKNDNYPTKQQIALTLLNQFKTNQPTLKIKVIIADALYGTAEFMDKASKLFGNIQVISQIRSNQKIRHGGQLKHVNDYFTTHPGIPQQLQIRGGNPITAIVGSARLYVDAHSKKRFVIALKYFDITEYHYLIASDMSWRTVDIIQAYTLRWLVEVFFEDWKLYEGWGLLTKQPDEEGSSRSLILSLLLDHCLILHPEQLARLKNKQPAATVGSLQQKTQVDSLLTFIRRLLATENPEAKLEQLRLSLEEVFQLHDSKKHMNTRELGRLEPTASLKYRALAAEA